MEEQEPKSKTFILGIKWWHFIGGGGTLIGIILAGVALWQHFDLKAHDQRILDETKATIERNRSDISINIPDVNVDVDGTVEAIGDKIDGAKQSLGNATEKATTATSEFIDDAGTKASGALKATKNWGRGMVKTFLSKTEPPCEEFVPGEVVEDICSDDESEPEPKEETK